VNSQDKGKSLEIQRTMVKFNTLLVFEGDKSQDLNGNLEEEASYREQKTVLYESSLGNPRKGCRIWNLTLNIV
jgi:hypothetical protein